MAFKVSRPSGITRVSEKEQERSLSKEEAKNPTQIGNFCTACDKFYNYLKPEQKLCTACNSRSNIIKK
jgi:aspartyl/asparaginyl-tRNA synthetase